MQDSFVRPDPITILSLSISYLAKRRRVDALSDVSFAVSPGESVAVRGPSGSGKTTLLFAIAGLVRARPGAITVGETDVGALDEEAAADFRLRRIGMVFQFFHLLPALSAVDNVALPLRLSGLDAGTSRRLAAERLEELGVADRAAHLPHELSGGEQQRVAVARAVVGQPSVILADEPTGNLDDKAASVVGRMLVEVSRERSTLLVATHDERLASLVSRRLTLDGGQLSSEA